MEGWQLSDSETDGVVKHGEISANTKNHPLPPPKEGNEGAAKKQKNMNQKIKYSFVTLLLLFSVFAFSSPIHFNEEYVKENGKWLVDSGKRIYTKK